MIADLLVPFSLVLITGLPLISLLKKTGFFKPIDTRDVDVSNRNPLYYKHLHKQITPSSFGIALSIPLTYIFIRNGLSSYLIFTTLFLFLGLFDDVVKYRLYYKTSFWGLKAWQKLLLQLTLCSFFMLTSPTATTFSVFVVLSSIFVINSYNITDGLDRLVAVPSIISLFGFLILEKNTLNDLFFVTLILSLLGYLAAFLIFNWRPALVHLGDSGALAIGFLMSILFFRYNPLLSIPLIMVFLLEGGSSLVQIFSIKIFKRKVFKIAPLHLHLLNSGWSQDKIVTVFSLFQLFCLAPIFIWYR